MALERIREREAALTDIRDKLEGANVAERSARQALEESEVKRAAVDAEVTELRAALAASDQDKLSLNASLLESREEVSRLNDRLQLSSEEVAELAGEVERLQAKVDDGARRVSEMSGIAAAQMAAVRASEEHRSDAVTQLRVSLDLMAAETEELEQDCRQLAEQRADAVSAADAWRNRCLRSGPPLR
jgi:chromosome segregation ATPase